MLRGTKVVVCCVGLLLFAQAGIANAGLLTWNAATDFGSTNPSSAWSYGWNAPYSATGRDGTYVDYSTADAGLPTGVVYQWSEGGEIPVALV